MSIFDKIKRGFQRAPNQIIDSVHRGVDALEHATQEGEHAIEGAAHQAQADVQKTAGEVNEHIQSAVNKGKEAIQKQLEAKQNEFVSNVTRVGKEVVSGVEEEVKKDLTKLWHTLEDEAKKEVVKKSLRTLLDFVEKIPVSSISEQISFIQFTIDSPGDKVKAIEDAIKSPPSTHKEIVEFIKAVGAGSVTLDLDFEFFSSIAEEDTQVEISVEKLVDVVDWVEQEIENSLK